MKEKLSYALLQERAHKITSNLPGFLAMAIVEDYKGQAFSERNEKVRKQQAENDQRMKNEAAVACSNKTKRQEIITTIQDHFERLPVNEKGNVKS